MITTSLNFNQSGMEFINKKQLFNKVKVTRNKYFSINS